MLRWIYCQRFFALVKKSRSNFKFTCVRVRKCHYKPPSLNIYPNLIIIYSPKNNKLRIYNMQISIAIQTKSNVIKDIIFSLFSLEELEQFYYNSPTAEPIFFSCSFFDNFFFKKNIICQTSIVQSLSLRLADFVGNEMVVCVSCSRKKTITMHKHSL